MLTNLMLLSSGVGSFFSKVYDCFKDSFMNFDFVRDTIDILILTIVLFLAFKFIKGRKAGVLLIGIAILIIFTALASAFNLDATYYVFSQIFKVGIIAIVIIFQPEIRDALEKVGSGSINSLRNLSEQNNKKGEQYSEAITHICQAIAELSAKKTGALIAISRTTKLDDVMQSGVKIDADVNSFLIRTIFFNNSPLHDGAVIIDDMRIAAAGCILPLSTRTDLDSEFGTRHRAALGMSERSDALVIIVSEETGIISVADDGELTRDYTADTLRKVLVQKITKASVDENSSEDNT